MWKRIDKKESVFIQQRAEFSSLPQAWKPPTVTPALTCQLSSNALIVRCFGQKCKSPALNNFMSSANKGGLMPFLYPSILIKAVEEVVLNSFDARD